MCFAAEESGGGEAEPSPSSTDIVRLMLSSLQQQQEIRQSLLSQGVDKAKIDVAFDGPKLGASADASPPALLGRLKSELTKVNSSLGAVNVSQTKTSDLSKLFAAYFDVLKAPPSVGYGQAMSNAVKQICSKAVVSDDSIKAKSAKKLATAQMELVHSKQKLEALKRSVTEANAIRHNNTSLGEFVVV